MAFQTLSFKILRFFSGMAFSKVVRVVCQSRCRFVRPWENMTSLRVCLLPAAIVIFFLPINLFVCFLTASFLVLLLLFICNVRQMIY